MNKICLIFCLVVCMLLTSRPSVKAQEHEVMQLVLNLEKLNQLRDILQKMYDGYQIVVEGYNKVKDITSGNFQLHEVFLDGLYLVSPEVKKYRRVVDIIDYQSRLVREYKDAFARFKASGAFTIDQIDYLATVYGRLFSDSLQSLDELLLVITARQLRMTDDERIKAIDRIADDMVKKYAFLKSFNNQQGLLALTKLKAKTESQTIKNLYGIKD